MVLLKLAMLVSHSSGKNKQFGLNSVNKMVFSVLWFMLFVVYVVSVCALLISDGVFSPGQCGKASNLVHMARSVHKYSGSNELFSSASRKAAELF